MMNSIGKRLALSVTALLLVVGVLLGSVAYLQSTRALTDSVHLTLTSKAEDAAKLVSSRLDYYLSSMTAIASQEVMRSGSLAQKLAVCAAESKRLGFIYIGVSDTAGQLRSTSGRTTSIADWDSFPEIMAGGLALSDPTPNVNDGTLISLVGTPIKDASGRVIGAVVGVLDGAVWSQLAADITYGESGKAFMVNKNGVTIAHSNIDLVKRMDNNFENVKTDLELKQLVELEKRMVAGETGVGEYAYAGVKKFMGYAPVAGTDWSIAIAAPHKEVFAGMSKLTTTVAGSTLLLLVIGVGLAILIGNALARPVKQATALAETIASGRLTEDIPEGMLRRNDELGRLAHAFHSMSGTLRQTIGKMHELAQELAASGQQLTAASETVSSNMQEVTASTEEIAAGLETVSAATEEMSASSQEMAASLNHLSQEVEQGDQEAAQITERAATIKRRAESSNDSARTLSAEIKANMLAAIEKATVAKEISTLADAISSIATQTNLLALNAAIESARAGEAGRGFAVVAEQVRKLAGDSAQAVQRIQAVTQDVLQSINELVDNSNKMLAFVSGPVTKDYDAMIELSQQYQRDADMVHAMTGQVKEISGQVLTMVGEVNRAVESVAATITESAAGAGEISTSTQVTGREMIEVSEASVRLAQAAEELNALVQKFEI